MKWPQFKPLRVFFQLIVVVILVTGIIVTNRLVETRTALRADIDTTAPKVALASYPRFDVSKFPTARPIGRARSCEKVTSMSGVWMPYYMDDPSRLMFAGMSAPNKVDLAWLKVSEKGTILETPGYAYARRLQRALQTAYRSNECGSRYVTITVDNDPDGDGKSNASGQSPLALRFLLSQQLREQFVRNVAQFTSSHELISGVTLDMTVGLPSTEEGLRTVKAPGDLGPLGTLGQIEVVSQALNRLVGELAVALHHQGRKLNVVVATRTDDAITSEYLLPYLFDYPQLGAYADQITLNATDLSYSGGNPGPIAPAAWVEQNVTFVTRAVPKAKLLVRTSSYAYDWQVSAWQNDPLQDRAATRSAKSLSVTDLASLARKAKGWQKVTAGPDGTLYRYRDKAGRPHDVWDASSSAVELARRLRISVTAWPIGNSDPAGMKQVLGAL